jgi:hypothetical protein
MFSLAACDSEGVAPDTAANEPASQWAVVEAAPPAELFEFSSATQAPASAASTVSLAEAQSKLSFGLPAWAPEGFALQPEVDYAPPTAILIWLSNDEASFTLQVSLAGSSQMGTAGAAEAATVQGQPAILIRSGLKHTRLSLNWTMNGLAYTLSADEASLSADNLKKIAESIK